MHLSKQKQTDFLFRRMMPDIRLYTFHNKRINVEYRDDNRTIGNDVLAYISLCCFYSNAKFKYHSKNTAK